MSLTTTLLRSRAVAALAAPHSVDRYLELANPMWAATEVRARIVDRHVEVDVAGTHVVTLTLQPTSTWAGHRAGQHVQVGVDLPGARRLTRCFSISSPDSRPGDPFTLTVRVNEGGRVSRHLATEARLGTIVHLSQAAGEFTLPDRVPDHVAFITGGSGITPAMAMLRSLLMRTHRGHITFIHYASSPEHLIFREELAELRYAGYGLDLHVIHPSAGGRYLSPMELDRLLPGHRDVDTWACGPAGLIEAVQAAYSDVDGASDRLRIEWFKPPTTATGDATGTVSFARSGTAAANTGEVILAQAEAAGLTPEFGCRMGICFTCTSRKSEGTVRNVLTGETSSLPDEDIRICVSTPEGDCSVEL